MADVRKEGPLFRTTRRIYRDKTVGYGRTLLFPQNALIKAAQVEEFDLAVESVKPERKSRTPKENK